MSKPIDQATKHLWPGKWLDHYFVLKNCPLCNEPWTFRFYGKTAYVWECMSCKQNGGIDELVVATRNKGYDHDALARLSEDLKRPVGPDGLIVVSTHRPRVNVRTIASGIVPIDRMTGGFPEGSLSILSGEQRSGKSTLSSQLALNAIQEGEHVCFYSGELSADLFQSWIYRQAAGGRWLEKRQDRFGVDRFYVDDFVRSRIEQWLDDKLILHDNTHFQASEPSAVLKSFIQARRHYGCTLFFADNLMTMRNEATSSSGYWLEQSRMVGELIDFAQQENVHVILVAHPRKEQGEDRNKNVAGSQEVTQRSSFVMTVERPSKDAKINLLNGGQLKYPQTTNALILSKNRIHGDEGTVEFEFEPESKRLIELPSGKEITYGWEEYV